jgi:hypothetical protein
VDRARILWRVLELKLERNEPCESKGMMVQATTRKRKRLKRTYRKCKRKSFGNEDEGENI